MKNQSEEGTQNTARKSGLIYGAVMSLVFSVLSCLLAGWLLDKYFETSPYLVVAGILLGAVAGFYQFIRTMSRVN